MHIDRSDRDRRLPGLMCRYGGKVVVARGGDISSGAEKPTLKTISRLSGLAVPTVSRALNDAPDIGSKTKILVRQIAEEIGYVPNRAGVRLRTGRTNVISLVLSTEHDMMNHTAKLITAISGGLRGTPFHMIMTPYFPTEDPMKPIRYIVESGSADAIIFNQTRPDDPRVAYLMERGFPFATHGRTQWSDAHPWFDYDNTAFGRIGVETLVQRGRRTLLMIAPPRDQSYGQHMIDGASAAAAKAGVVLTVPDQMTSDDLITDMRAFVAAKVAADPTIDGIICGSTNATMAAVAGMESEGFDVGTDIDVYSKEAMPFLRFFRGALIVVHEDVAKAGEFLAKAAIQAIRDPQAPPMQGLQLPDEADTLSATNQKAKI